MEEELQPITITITYSLALQEITGKAMESIVVAEGLPIFHFMLDLFDMYPKIQEKYPQGTLAFTIDDKSPGEDYFFENGDTICFKVLKPEYWHEIPKLK